MHSLITSYLLQSKECILPGIGILQIIHTPASTDGSAKRVLPPFEGIIFKKEDHSKSPGLIKYIGDKKNIEQREAEDRLNGFCKEWKEKINAGERLTFETVGSILNNADGIMVFEKENHFNFLQQIAVNDTYLKTEIAEPIVEEPAAPEVFEEVDEDIVVERSYWGFWALILLAIGAVVIFYNFKDHKLSGSTTGNQHQYHIDSATPTYTIPNK
jgi:hypothetical protein